MNKKQPEISQNVLSQIKSGDVKMRPSVYFTILSAIIITSSIVAAVAISYLSSIIFFWVRIAASNSAAYGARRNLDELITSFPWWTLLIIAALMFGVIILVRRYGTVYRYKTQNIIIVILLISIVLGAGLSALGIGDIKHTGQNNQQKQQNGPMWNN